MKNTAKRLAALAVDVVRNGKRLESDVLYSQLEAEGWFWYPKEGVWKQDRPQTSEFQLANGKPSDVFRMRLMAHPDELYGLARRIQIALAEYGADTIIEISERAYPNRNGMGARVYLSGLIQKGQ